MALRPDSARARAHEAYREVTLDPAPRLRPLTWAGAEDVCALLRAPDADATSANEAGPRVRPVALREVLGGRLPAPPDERAPHVPLSGPFLALACEDSDPGLAIARRSLPEAVVAELVLTAWLEEVAAEGAAAYVYRGRRLSHLGGFLRGQYARLHGLDAEALAYGVIVRTDDAPPDDDDAPNVMPTASALALRGPEAWAVLADWPLARMLRYLEDAHVGAFVAEVEAEAQKLRGGSHG